MAIRLRGKVASNSGTVYTVHILDTTYSGTTLDVELREPGFNLEYHGGEDIYTPIVPSTVTVPMLVTDGSVESFFTQLQTADEGRFRLAIRSGNTDTSPLFWAGTITSDNVAVKDAPYPYDIEIKAVDGLQLLSRQNYNPASINTPVLNHIVEICKLCGTSDLHQDGGTLEAFVTLLADTAPDVATAADPYTDVKIDARFYDLATQQYTQFDYTAEAFLDNLLRCYNTRIFYTEGSFWLMPVNKYVATVSGSLNVAQYANDASLVNSAYNVTSLAVMAEASTSAYKVSFWERTLLPPLREVVRPVRYGDGLIVTNMPGQGAQIYPQGSTTGDTIASYQSLAQQTYPSGTTFRMQGNAVIICTGNSSTYPTGKLRVGIEVKVGNYYLRRQGVDLDTSVGIDIPGEEFENVGTQTVYEWGNPEEAVWDTTDTDRYQVGSETINYDLPVVYVSGQPNYIEEIPIGFTTPELPAEVTGQVRVSFVCILLKGNGNAMPSSIKDITPVYVRFRFGAGSGSSDSATFTASYSNAATETREEEPVYFGSQLIGAGEYQFNPSEFKNVNGALPQWTTITQTTGVNINQAAVNDIARYRKTVKEIYSGTLLYTPGFIAPYSWILDSDSSTSYIIVSLNYSPSQEEHGLELHEANSYSTDAPTEEVTVKPGAQPPSLDVGNLDKRLNSGRRFIRLASEQIADVETDVNALTTTVDDVVRTSDSGGGLSSILLAYLGDVKISSPANGQILEYNSTAGRWANVTPTSGTDNSLSEADQTISGGTTREIVLDGSGASIAKLNIVDGQGNVLESVQAYGSGVAIQEKYGALAVRSTAVFQGSLALYEASANGINSISIKSPASVSSNKTFTLPDSYGTSGQALTTDGAGTLSWASASGGGMTETPLIQVGGRYMWSSTDSGERVHTGSTAYSPTNWYSHSSEPSQSGLRVYSSSHTVDTTTQSISGFHLMGYAHYLPSDSKKVRVKYFARYQNGNGQTFGFSVWHVASLPQSGSPYGAQARLIAKSADITAGSSSTALYHGTFTATTAYGGGAILVLAEHRSGTLTTTTYAYTNISLFLVD